jgi:hypothetical protein
VLLKVLRKQIKQLRDSDKDSDETSLLGGERQYAEGWYAKDTI